MIWSENKFGGQYTVQHVKKEVQEFDEMNYSNGKGERVSTGPTEIAP